MNARIDFPPTQGVMLGIGYFPPAFDLSKSKQDDLDMIHILMFGFFLFNVIIEWRK